MNCNELDLGRALFLYLHQHIFLCLQSLNNNYMRTRPLFLSLALISCLIGTGCNKTGASAPEPKIPIRINSTVTKVSGDSFESGDAIGVYVVNATREPGSSSWSSSELQNSGNHLDNILFSYNESTNEWKADKEYYWKDSVTPADFYCYYPYLASAGDVSSVKLSLPSDQSSEEAFKSSEILWGKSSLQNPSDNKVSITTTHRTSQIIIRILPGKGFDEESLRESLKSVRINNIKCSCTLNLKDGSLSAEGDAKDITPYFDGSVYKAMIAPQSIEGQKLITLEVDGLERSLTQSIEFTSGSRKTCTLTVNKLSEGINVGIGGWEDDGNDYGGTLN